MNEENGHETETEVSRVRLKHGWGWVGGRKSVREVLTAKEMKETDTELKKNEGNSNESRTLTAGFTRHLSLKQANIL